MRQLNHHVIYIHLHIAPYLVSEDQVDKALICASYRLQSKRHPNIVEDAYGSDESDLLDISGVYEDLVITSKDIKEIEYLMSCSSINEFV